MGTVRYTILDGQIVAEKRGASRKFYESDALGSTVALYDNTQTKTDSFTYWPYGETRTSTETTGTKFKYVGTLGCRTQFDGGIYMRARVQQPDEGRWLTDDPIGDHEEPYSYCFNNPETFVDVSGLRLKEYFWDKTVKPACFADRATNDLLAKKLSDKKCAKAISDACGKSFGSIIKSVPFFLLKQCKPNDGVKACTFWPSKEPGSITDKCVICIPQSTCESTRPLDIFKSHAELKVCVLLFEIGNYCMCKAGGKDDKSEPVARKIHEACGCPKLPPYQSRRF